MERGVTQDQIIALLSLSVHGKLDAYVPVVRAACAERAELLAHTIAYDFVNGQVKDSKLALPVITLATPAFPDELIENSLAHLAMQPPRELLKGLQFSIQLGAPARRQKLFERVVHTYLALKEKEPGKWHRLAARHRRSLKTLYALTHCPAPEWVSNILFRNIYPPGSIFADIANLSKMEPAQAAAAIQKWHLSPLVVSGAMAGAKTKQQDPAVVQATMNQMSDTEVITRAASLERQGLSRDPALKETFRKKVAKATKSNKATLKTSVAAEEVEDEGLKTMLRELQERQIQAQKDAGRGIEGNWLVIADKSQSQDIAIEMGKHIAAAITKFVSGHVYLAFCDVSGVGKEVTGKTLEEIRKDASFVRAGGSTSYGVGLMWALDKKFDLDGVAIVGDGGENTPPFFGAAHQEYRKRKDKDLPVYFFQTYVAPEYANTPGGNPHNFEVMMNRAQIPVTKFDLTHGEVDYYSLPALCNTMHASRFGVVEKILAVPLVELVTVLPNWVAKKGATCHSAR